MPLIPAFEIGIWNAWIFMSSFILQMLAVLLLGKMVWARSSLPSDFKRSKREKITPIIGNSVWLLATLYSIFLPLRLGLYRPACLSGRTDDNVGSHRQLRHRAGGKASH